MGHDRSLDQLHALGDGTHLLFQESVDLVETPPRTTPNKTYEDATHRLEVNVFVAIENENLPTVQNLAVDRAKRRDHTSVAINSTPQGLQLQFVDDFCPCLGQDSPTVPSVVYCCCFSIPLLGMTELIPMLEFGIADPIQVHAVEACTM